MLQPDEIDDYTQGKAIFKFGIGGNQYFPEMPIKGSWGKKNPLSQDTGSVAFSQRGVQYFMN